MARIRTIKPEFTESETVGKLSREARLLFILLWTIVDDDGRARAASRKLASTLYPYDDDAISLIDDWLDELEQGQHIRRYVVDNSTYLDIPKWRLHQRIDKPSASKIPKFEDGSPKPPRNLREASHTEGTLEGNGSGKGVEGEGKQISLPARDPEILEAAVEAWNRLATDIGLPVVQRLTEPRKKSLAVRLGECGGLEGWDIALAKVRDSPFLRGENNRGWKADFDFLLQQKSFTKLMEGGFNGSNRQTQSDIQRALDDERSRVREGDQDFGFP